MMISTRGRYTLRILLDIAEYQKDGYVPLRDSAERQDISKKYLEQIINLPDVSKMLDSSRGLHGGYRLSRSPEEYTVGDILRAAEGSIRPVSCLEEDNIPCGRSADCPFLPIWKGLDDVICNYLDSITLQDIIDRRSECRGGNDYVI